MKKNKPRLGQHFLNNPTFYNNILKHLGIEEEDNIIEIGAGLGYFTKEIIKYSKNITVIEIEKKFCEYLEKEFSGRIKIINSDFLKINLEKIIQTGRRNILLGNIPYYITGPIIEKCIEEKERINKFGLMVQKEYYRKLIAKANEKEYTFMSVIFRLNFKIEKDFEISKEAFKPAPKCDSTFMIFKKNDTLLEKEKYEEFIDFVKKIFKKKRKKIKNSLRLFLENEEIKKIFREEELEKRIENYDIIGIKEIFSKVKNRK